MIPLTTNLRYENAPGNIFIEKEDSGLSKDSIVVVSQIYAIDKSRMIEKVKKLSESVIRDIENGILLVLGIKI